MRCTETPDVQDRQGLLEVDGIHAVRAGHAVQAVRTVHAVPEISAASGLRERGACGVPAASATSLHYASRHAPAERAGVADRLGLGLGRRFGFAARGVALVLSGSGRACAGRWTGLHSLVGLTGMAALVGLVGCAALPGGLERATPRAAVQTAAAATPVTGPTLGDATVRARSEPVRLPAPRPVRSWGEVRLQAAQRMVAADPNGTYTGPSPDPLLAIPVLEIELNGDGSVRRIVVLRHPRQARDTVRLATEAVHRAAPFGDVSRLPRPWRFVETFLFDDDRRFKPRTLEP